MHKTGHLTEIEMEEKTVTQQIWGHISEIKGQDNEKQNRHKDYNRSNYGFQNQNQARNM